VAAMLFAGLLLGAAFRYGILENQTQAMICNEQNGGGWCSLRPALGWSIYHQIFGFGGLFLAMAAWLPRLRPFAFPALLVGGCGLFVYNTTYAAVAVVVAILAALRPAALVK
jgi:hypothetical protein